MSHETKSVLGAIVASFIIVAGFAFLARVAFADGPPQVVIDNQPIIEDAKKRLEKNRPAHEAFLADKALIEEKEKENNALGWRTDWATLKPVPIETSNPPISKASAKLKQASSDVWRWSGAEDYKNDKLAEFQKLLKERGITDKEHLKILTAMLIQENGRLDENRDGDYGCSIGLAQRNVCIYGYNARSFREKYPVWKDYKTQLAWLADNTAKHYQKYDGDVFRTVVAHNRPVSANAGVDRCMDKKTWKLVSSCPKNAGWCSCYFRDEVSQRLDLLTL